MIAVVALAQALTARFAPELDRPYRLTIAEERGDARHRWHFGIERRVVFRRDGAGFVAEVTLVGVTQDMGGEAGRRAEATAGALRGRTIRFRLATDGALFGIDDEAAVWDAVAAAMDRSSGYRTAATLAALSPAARRATIGSIILPVVAGADAARAPGSRAITLPSRPVAAGTPLAGHEEVTVDATSLRIVTHADAAAGTAAISVDRERSLDPRHGLVTRADESQTTRLGEAIEVTRKVTTLSLVQ